MKEQQPLLTVGLAVYNEAGWIRQSLDSLLNQTLTDFEIFAADNVSTDGTWEILQEYAARDPRLIVHRQPENCGAIANFRYVLEQARGEYFMWASGHDRWSPNLLEVLLSHLHAHPHAGLCMPQCVLIDENNDVIKVFNTAMDTTAAASAAGRVLAAFKQPKRSNGLYGLYRREVILKTLPWPKVAGIDLIIVVRAAAQADVITVPTVQWFRRKIRHETVQQKKQRHMRQYYEAKDLTALFPYLIFRLTLMQEFLRLSGSWSQKIELLRYGFRMLFLRADHPKVLLKEFVYGCRALISIILTRRQSVDVK